MNDSSPPILVKKFDYQSVKQISLAGKRLYESPDGSKTPSVTTILNATKDMRGLMEWRKRVGVKNAQKITTEAAGIGTAMHNNLERFLLGEERMTDQQPLQIKANAMAQKIIDNGLSNVNEVWAIEQALYYPHKYSGTADLIGEYKKQPAVMDFKQSNKPKKEEWIEDYYLQLGAYSLAHNVVYNSRITQGIVLLCTVDNLFQDFRIQGEKLEEYQNKFLEKVEQYYHQRNMN